MLLRQKILINLIKNADREISRLTLVKLGFLFAHESKAKETKTFYEFVPYKYGPFSFTLYHELTNLIRDGYISEVDERILSVSKLSDYPDVRINLKLDDAIKQIIKCFGKFNDNELIDFVYQHYPWFTLSTELKDKRTVTLRKAENKIYTAGYEGYQIDGFLDLLLRCGIRRLIDVRSNPMSRKYGYHKTSLKKICSSLDIEYVHAPELGIKSENRINIKTNEDYKKLFDDYECKVLPNNKDVIEEVIKLIQTSPSVLVCQEADPLCCHRTRLANYISQITGLEVCNLGG